MGDMPEVEAMATEAREKYRPICGRPVVTPSAGEEPWDEAEPGPR
jgi:hypothetical protein